MTTSPGFIAEPPGKFSVLAIRPITLIGKLSRAQALRVPRTLAAPHISYFISSIPEAGFNEIPPESKVIPLPTSTIGACLSAPV